MAPAQKSPLLRYLRKLAAGGSSPRPDRQLLDDFSSHRDETAFAALVARHGPMVLRVCRRVLNHEQDAEDAFQATFLVLARSTASIRQRDALAAWLHGVAYRTAMEAKRKAGRRRHHEARLWSSMSKAAVSPSWDDVQAILDEEIQRLPEAFRAAFVLCVLEGKSGPEAAAALGVKEATVWSRLTRARQRLQQRLTRRGINLAALLAALSVAESAQAQVTVALTDATIRSGLLVAAGGSPAGVIPSHIAALAAGVARAMFLTKVKTATAVLLAVTVVTGAGVLALARQTLIGPPPEEEGERPKPAAQASDPLTSSPPGVKGKGVRGQVRIDRYGDPLPPGAIARLGTMRFNHGDGLNALYFSPDGKTIISEGGGVLRFWDAGNGKELRQFATAKPSFDDQTALSPDGKTMIFLNQDFPDTVRVWDLTEGKEVRTVPLPVRRNGMSVYHRNALSPDGRLCAIHTPKLQGAIQTPEQIQVFDIATARELYKLPPPFPPPAGGGGQGWGETRAVIFAGNDRLVTADKKQVIRVWEARTGKPLREFAHGSPVEVLTSSTDGRQLATLEHHNYAIDRELDKDVVHVWDLTTGTRKHALAARPKRWYMNVQFAPDGKFLFTSSFGGDGNELTVWDLATGERVREFAGAPGKAIAVSPDGSHLAEGALPGKVDLWDLKTGRRLSSEDSAHSFASRVFLSPTGERAFTIGFSSVSTWDATTGQRLHSFALPPYPYGDAHGSRSLDGRYALSYTGNFEQMQMHLWDIATGRKLHTLEAPGASLAVTSAFSPDSSLLAACIPGKETVVRIWDVRRGKEVRSFKETKAGWPGRLFFTADGKILFVAGRQVVVGFDGAGGKELFSWRMKPLPSKFQTQAVGGRPVGPEDRLAWRTLCVSPEGDKVACILLGGGDFSERVENRIVLREARTGKVLHRWNDSGIPSNGYEELAFSHDGRLLASSDRRTVHLWEVATGKEVRAYQGHRGEIQSLTFSANGRRLASASSDHTVVIWDLVSAPRPAGGLVEQPGEKQVGAWWADLAAEDAATAYAAIWRLAEAPSASVPFLRERLKPVPDTQAKQMRQSIDDLDNDSFAVREKAFHELNRLGPAAAPALREALENKGSLELRRRVEQLLANLNGPISGEPLRDIRALAVLEHAGTPEAHRLVQALAAGASGAWLTQEAKASLERLNRRIAAESGK